AGITVEPSRIFRFTLDIYQTKIDDRIVKTDFLGTAANGGAVVGQLLREKGINGVDSAQYFTNAIDTTTRGIDLVTELTLKSDSAGTFKPSAAYSFADTRIDHVAKNPAELANLNVTLFGRQVQRDLIKGSPRSKVVLGGNWAVWRFKTDLRVTRYDSYIESSTVASADQRFSAKWITDLDVGYGITDNLSLAIGAYNLFNKYPDKVGLKNNEGSGAYGSFAPFGLSGGFYYARLALNL
ncbi:MAG: hypothetical protein RLZZ450_7349, partial [Pseudomonadota bacterium]